MSISAELVKELRDKTGAGIMDCKRALQEKNGDLDAATKYLREKGIAAAEKRASRIAKEGLIASYIHMGGKIGVLIEVNCETDFVARTPAFQEFVKDLTLQICSADPLCVSREDVPATVMEREKDIYLTQARQTGKPEKILQKMVDGKVEKFFEERCLLEQKFVKDPDKTIEQYLKEIIAKTGENIVIRRFVRFQLGEDLK